MDSSRFDPIRTMAKMTDEVIVAFSGGKESIVVLDLCVKHFKRVVPFFMYYVPGLSFQEKQLRWYEDKYGLEIVRLPHFELSNLMRYGTYRNIDLDVPIIGMNEIYQWMRETYGINWIAAGERSGDSVIRGAMIKHSGSIDEKRGRFYPVAWWTKQEILDYIRVKKLYQGMDSRVMGTSFHGINTPSLVFLNEYFPTDYQRALRLFPLAEGAITRYKTYGKKQVSEL